MSACCPWAGEKLIVRATRNL